MMHHVALSVKHRAGAVALRSSIAAADRRHLGDHDEPVPATEPRTAPLPHPEASARLPPTTRTNPDERDHSQGAKEQGRR